MVLQRKEVMSPLEAQPAGETTAPLTQWQRVGNIFAAPSKTFADIQRGHRSWWLPFIILALAGYIFFAAVAQKVGMQQVVDNQVRLNPKAQERLSQLTPEQRAASNRLSVGITEAAFLGAPVLGLVVFAVFAGAVLGTINFIFGGKARYGDVFAVYYYAWLPQLLKLLLGIVVLYAGMAPESFNAKNFAPTNIGAFLDPVDTNPVLYALATAIDGVTIWTLVVLSIGVAAVAGVKRSSAYIAVFGWWVLGVLVSVGFAAIFG